jgi:hypothetical protein
MQIELHEILINDLVNDFVDILTHLIIYPEKNILSLTR